MYKCRNILKLIIYILQPHRTKQFALYDAPYSVFIAKKYLHALVYLSIIREKCSYFKSKSIV